MALSPGQRLGSYEIVGLLGAGGMGEVYEALDTRLQRRAALKVLPAISWRDPERSERFLREARAASALNHPNIVTIYEIESHEGADFIAMELIRGQSLAKVLASGPLAVSDALGYARQIANALTAAHNLGIIHRDLKPANVMIQDSGVLKLLDFGLAKFLHHEPSAGDDVTRTQSLTRVGAITGTVAYMSPEQALASPLDHRTDIFSLGVVFYEMLTGVRPFSGRSAQGILHEIIYSVPTPASKLRPDVPAFLDGVLDRALAKSPEERFPDLLAFEKSLLKAEPPATVTTSASTPLASSRSWLVRPRTLLGLAVPLAALAGVAYFGPDLRNRVTPFLLPSSTIDYHRQGLAFLEKYDLPGNLDKAEQLFRRALETDNSHAASHAALAECYLVHVEGQPDPQWLRMAMDEARKAEQLDPYLASSHVALATAQMRSKKPDLALQAADKAILLDPTSSAAHRVRADSLEALKRFPEAEAAYRKAVSVPATTWADHNALGWFLYRQGRYADSTAALENAARIHPDSPTIRTNLATAYHAEGRDEEAAASLQRSLALRPTSMGYSNLGTILFFSGRYADAAEAFERAISKGANRYITWGNLGDAYRWAPGLSGKSSEAYQNAIALVRREVSTSPNDPNLLSILALYLSKSGKTDEARQTVEALKSSEINRPNWMVRLAVAHELTGNRKEALAFLQSALRGGYPRKEIEAEPEFLKLRQDPGYHRTLLATSK